MRFFRAETTEELFMVATASPAIQKAAARVMKLSKDERARLLYEYEIKARRDEIAKIDAAVTGERITIARNALDMKMPLKDISKLTGFSFDEIKKLAH
ncbi:MAG: Rpn family recombination-promoting nuclease/putative transposase [Acidobacteriota bacterium]|nr:Rpn family recombination-promoting nuclease/putative transposase [Acidobacteriota bacterium]